MKKHSSSKFGGALAMFALGVAASGPQVLGANSLDNRVLFDFEDQTNPSVAVDQTASSDPGYFKANSFAPGPAYSTAQAYSGTGSALWSDPDPLKTFNDFIVISNTINFSSNFELSMAIRLTEFPATGMWMTLFSKGLHSQSAGGGNFKLLLYNNGSGTRLYYQHATGSGDVLGNTSLALDQWQVVGVTFSNTTPGFGVTRLFVNGVLDSAFADTTIAALDAPSYIGYSGLGQSNDQGYRGYIDLFQIIPEPSTILLAGLGGLLALRSRRRPGA